MTQAFARHTGARCRCGDVIRKGDVIEMYDDYWWHSECVPAPPSETAMDSLSAQLRNLLATRGELAWHILQTDLDPDSLPPLVAEKFWEVVAAESHLLSLLDDVASEHSVERT